MKQIPNLARMRAFNGDYIVFTTITRRARYRTSQ